MAGIGEWITDMLEYNTIKVVRVRSKVLGGLHYAFMLGIALYIVLYVFIDQKHYLAIEIPQGLQRITVQDPCDPLSVKDECTFPSFTGAESHGQVCLPPKAFRCPHHDYCTTASTPAQDVHGGVGGKLKCRFWDHNSMVWPPGESGAMTIASRASLINQKLMDIRLLKNGTQKLCDAQTDMQCQWHPPVIDHKSYAKDDAYMGDLGNFTVRVSHSMWAPTFPIEGNSAEMEGWLMKCKPGHDCSEDPDAWMPIKHLPPTGGADQLFMRDVFYAATPAKGIGVHGPGLDMDAKSDACPRKCNGKDSTYRFMGLVLHVGIVYDNTGTVIKGSSPDNVKYQMKIFTKPSTIFHIQVVNRGTEKNKRVIHHLYGPRVVFGIGGKLGQLQWNNVIIQLTTSLAMFALATTLVDLLMLYVLPKRDKYYHVKYDEVDDALLRHSVREDHMVGMAGTESKADEVFHTKDPDFPPGMDRPPGMQPRGAGEQSPLLGS